MVKNIIQFQKGLELHEFLEIRTEDRQETGHIWTPQVSQGLMDHNYHLIPPRITDERKTVFNIYPAS
jgi:hypothetical protein